MKNNIDRIIIDTNLWISFLISKNYTQLDKILLSEESVLIFSDELLNEFLSVVKRAKFRKFFTQEDTENLIESIMEHSEFVIVKSKVEICRDIKDNFLLSLAKDSKSNFLITGDKDLLELENFEQTKILTITEYLKTIT